MSSRNRYLEGAELQRGGLLSRALAAGEATLARGEREVAAVEKAMLELLDTEGVRPDYAELRTVPDLRHPMRAKGRILLAVAAYVGRARLIDNRCLQVGDTVAEVPLLDSNTATALMARWSLPR